VCSAFTQTLCSSCWKNRPPPCFFGPAFFSIISERRRAHPSILNKHSSQPLTTLLHSKKAGKSEQIPVIAFVPLRSVRITFFCMISRDSIHFLREADEVRMKRPFTPHHIMDWNPLPLRYKSPSPQIRRVGIGSSSPHNPYLVSPTLWQSFMGKSEWKSGIFSHKDRHPASASFMMLLLNEVVTLALMREEILGYNFW